MSDTCIYGPAGITKLASFGPRGREGAFWSVYEHAANGEPVWFVNAPDSASAERIAWAVAQGPAALAAEIVLGAWTTASRWDHSAGTYPRLVMLAAEAAHWSPVLATLTRGRPMDGHLHVDVAEPFGAYLADVLIDGPGFPDRQATLAKLVALVDACAA